MSDLSGVLSRLENIASRLENVERQLGSSSSSSPSSSNSSPSSSPSSNASLAEFDAFTTSIATCAQLSGQIDKDLGVQAGLLAQAVAEERKILATAGECKKPDASVFMGLIKPCADLMGQVSEIREKNRGHKCFNHLSTLSEGINALGWITIEPTPGPHVDECRASSEFYSNKILVANKNVDTAEAKMQVEWVKSWNGWLKELRGWIKKYHTTGLTWTGAQCASSFTPSASAPAPKKSAPVPTKNTSSPSAGLFAEINTVQARQTGGRTEGLRKVTKDMKTKNQTNKSSVVSATPKKTGGRTFGKQSAVQRDPKFSLDGNKWVVEYHIGNKDIKISDTQTRQSVYVYKCEDSVIQISGKVNAITLDNCRKVGLVFENAVSAVEVVNCQSVQVQVTGSVPSVQVDKTSGCQIFLSKSALSAEIVTAKSDELNVVLPPKNEGDDITELAIPEQFKTVVSNGKLTTIAVEHV